MKNNVSLGLVAGWGDAKPVKKHDYYIGVDAGCLSILEAGLPLALAVGDFDSVSASEFEKIRARADRLVTAPAQKDDTDLELALQAVFQSWPQAKLTIYGGLGGRLDHSLVNVFLPSHPSLTPFMRQLCLQDEQNQIVFYPAGEHDIPAQSGYDYVAFMLEGGNCLTIRGAKYDLDQTNFFWRKIYSSNEFLEGPIQVSFDEGYLIVIYSKDK